MKFRWKDERRKIIVVDKKLQSRIIFSVTWPMAMLLGLTLVIMYFFGLHLKAEAAKTGTIVEGLDALFLSICFLFGYATVANVLVALSFSHKVAGAAYRITQTLRSFRKGERATRAHLRKGDFHMDLADEVNSFLDWIDQETGTPRKAEAEAAVVPQPEHPATPERAKVGASSLPR